MMPCLEIGLNVIYKNHTRYFLCELFLLCRPMNSRTLVNVVFHKTTNIGLDEITIA